MKNFLRSGAVAFLALIAILSPSITWAYSYGGSTMNYTYSGSIDSTDCSNPARGAGYYGDLYKVSSSSSLQLYLAAGSLGDPFIQVLGSDRTTIIGQDDDAGGGLNSYLTTGVVTTSDYVVATTFGQGATGTYTFYSNVPLTQVFSCPQAITFNQPSATQYGSTFNVSASTNMSLPVTMTSQTTNVCSVTTSSPPNFTISALQPGTCTLVASQPGDGSSEAATPVTRNVTINKKLLTLSGLSATKPYDGNTTTTITGTPTISGIVGSDSVSVTGTPSGSFANANAGPQTVNISGLSLTGAQAALYDLPTSFSGSISKINQTLSWSPQTILIPSNSGQNMAAATTTAGGGAITYAVQSAGTTGCTVSSRALSFTGQGNCVVRATAASNTNYNVATQDVTFTVSKLNQILSWSPTTSISATPTSRTLESATTSGNGAISYSVVTAGSASCAVSGLTLSFASAGSCRIKATAASTVDYNVDSSEFDFNISLVPQTVSWNPGILTSPVTSGTITPSATPASTGSGAISYSVTNQGNSDCSVNSSTGVITFTQSGICVVRATAAATSTEGSAYTDASFTITPVSQVVTWSPTNTSLTTAQSEAVPSTLATSSGSGVISYSLFSSSGASCQVNAQSGALTYRNAGTCTVRATAAATNRETSAYKDVVFTIAQAAAPTLNVIPSRALPAPTSSPSSQAVSSPVTKNPVTLTPSVAKNLTSSTGGVSQIRINEEGLPELLPLQSIGLQGGTPLVINLVPISSNEALSLSGQGFEVLLNSLTTDGTIIPLGTSGSLILQQGNLAQFSGTGFAPNSEVAIWMFSTPKFIGMVKTDQNGAFAGEVEVPADLALGEHTLQLNGLATTGETRSLSVGVEVAQPQNVSEQSAATDQDSTVIWVISLAVTLGALATVLLILRRRRAS